jgi:hypothetical protein
MSNTVIQIKRSSTTAVPTNGSLSAAEPAYSYSSNKLFLGSSDGAGTIAVGGKFFIDQQNTIFNAANTVYDQANVATVSAVAGQLTANTAYDKANAANNLAYSGSLTASASYDQANTATISAAAGKLTANTAYDKANSANLVASASFDFANTRFASAGGTISGNVNVTGNVNPTTDNIYSLGDATHRWKDLYVGPGSIFIDDITLKKTSGALTLTNAQDFVLSGTNIPSSYTVSNTASYAFDAANSAFNKANSANIVASASYDFANTRYSSSGGTITGDVSIVGNLTMSGNTTLINVSSYQVSDPLIYLAANNYTSDIVDIGFIANYVNATGSNVHTGVFRDAGSKEYYIFNGYDQEPVNNHIDPNGNNFTLSVLNAHIRTSNLSLGGQNAITWITSSYDKANTVETIATSAYAIGNLANQIAVASFYKANNVGDIAGASIITANAAYDKANAANILAYGVSLAAASGYDKANSANILAYNSGITASAGYDKANAANILAYSTSLTASAGYDKDNAANTLAYSSGLAAAAGYDKANAANIIAVAAFDYANTLASGGGGNNASLLTTGVVAVNVGGTGLVTITQNGILYGNTAGALKVTSAGTEGQVLQASSTGVPQFGMLDGGNF